MRLRICLITCVFAFSALLSGCALSDLPSVIFDQETGETSDENVTFSGAVFDDSIGSDIEIEKPESNKNPGDKVTSAGEAYNTITEVYHAIADSVVEITTESVQTSFWGQYVSSGAGSGVIIEKSGIIVTNYHVIEGANTVTVRLTDGSEYSASLIGYDEAGDLAIIKIDAGEKELTVASLGCSSDLEVGEDVVALGNPLGSLGGTLTTGIISATDRVLNVDGEEMVLLQTNAAINPGNSGGGLFNMAGQLVGIVNAKISEEGIEGLGFAIPIDVAFSTIDDLINYGYVRGVVDCGLTVMDVTAQNYYYFYDYGIRTTGVIVFESKNSAELKFGDKITEIDGVEISSSHDVEVVVKSHKVGDVLTVTVVRLGMEIEVELVLTEKIPEKVVFVE